MLALWLCLIPIAWVLIAHFVLPRTIVTVEAAVLGGGTVFIILVVYMAMFWHNTSDTEVLNGYVSGKAREQVSCSHSYQCMCVQSCSGSGSSQSCTQICQTCYEHPYDVDWNVDTTVGGLSIDRLSSQGLEMPPRWNAVIIGEPAAVEHNYTNYLRAAPNSLFNMKLAQAEAKQLSAQLPPPHGVYDYYRVNHVYIVGGAKVDAIGWDHRIDDILKTLGHSKQININVVFVAGQSRDYINKLERAWLGGKKNELNLAIGVTGTKIDWVEGFTFGKSAGNNMLLVTLRDRLQAMSNVNDARQGSEVIAALVSKYYVRKPMKDFAYLKDSAGPSTTQLCWLIGIVILLLIAGTIFFHLTDKFGANDYFADRYPAYGNFRRRYYNY